MFDQLTNYAREGPAAEFRRNLEREVRENPLPLVLIGIGIAWLIIACGQSSRARAKYSTVKEVGEISTGTSAKVSARSEGARAQMEAVRQASMPLPAAGLEYPGDSATSIAPNVNKEMRPDPSAGARAMEQAHEPQ